MDFSTRNRLLNHYFFASYLIMLVITSGYLRHISWEGSRTTLYAIAVYLTYSFIYLLPTLLLVKILHRIFYWLKRGARPSTAWIILTITCLGTGITDIVIFGDYTVYKLYNFHLNGFVWNLITAPGGIESMGGSGSTTVVLAVICCLVFVLQFLMLWTLKRILHTRLQSPPYKFRKIYLYLILLVLAISLGERVTYGVSKLQAYTPVLSAGNTFPFYMPMSFQHLAKKLGYKVEQDNKLRVSKGSKLHYPLKPLQLEKPEKLPNIVLLVSESWRWDMLNPEISPATWKFAQQAHRFTHNYSSGNGTRMGIFGFFYGLYAPYWFPILDARQSPVLMDTVQDLGYQISMYTSAKFTYPEFDRTVLANIPAASLHEYSSQGQGWERDHKNVGDLLKFIQQRDPQRPFFTFMFFESPHARYYFPPEGAIRKNYLKDFNYATMSLEKDIDLIKNRYINSCHYLDSQFKRIFDYLEDEELLNDTIVILAGDHGEEFMEKGRWGHNSEFHEEQTRTPLVLWVPGTGKSVSDQMTSHLDIAPTLLSLLGVTNPPSDYSLGYNLLGDYQRHDTVIGDWSRIAYVGEDFKLVLPFERAGFIQPKVTTKDDKAIKDTRGFLAQHNDVFIRLMQELNKFKQ
jgi:membrane-anchored protein YejM (alkaline phosphatase superfamily)